MHSISVPRIVSGRYRGLQEKDVHQGLVIGSRQDAARGPTGRPGLWRVSQGLFHSYENSVSKTLINHSCILGSFTKLSLLQPRM